MGNPICCADIPPFKYSESCRPIYTKPQTIYIKNWHKRLPRKIKKKRNLFIRTFIEGVGFIYFQPYHGPFIKMPEDTKVTTEWSATLNWFKK